MSISDQRKDKRNKSWLKKHHEIIDNNPNPSVPQTSLAELHRLNITLTNYFDVAPTSSKDITLPTTPETKTSADYNRTDIIV